MGGADSALYRGGEGGKGGVGGDGWSYGWEGQAGVVQF